MYKMVMNPDIDCWESSSKYHKKPQVKTHKSMEDRLTVFQIYPLEMKIFQSYASLPKGKWASDFVFGGCRCSIVLLPWTVLSLKRQKKTAILVVTTPNSQTNRSTPHAGHMPHPIHPTVNLYLHTSI